MAAHAQSGLMPPTGSTPLLSQEAASKADADQIATALGVTQAEALSRLNVESASAETVSLIRETYKDRLAGIFIEHAPQRRLVVRLKGNQSIPREILQFGPDTLAVEFVGGASHTTAELEAILARNIDGLKASVPGLQGVFTDDRTGEVVLDVVGERTETDRQAVIQMLGVPARIDILPAPLRTQAVRGSGALGSCTSAFVVQNASGLFHSEDSLMIRFGAISRHESRDCRYGHA